MYYDNWEIEYDMLFKKAKEYLPNTLHLPLTFELIQYRFTTKAKNVILQRFPNTKLDMDEENRIKKWGPYGVYKYVYPKDVSEELKNGITNLINKYFPNSYIEYFT